MIGKILDLDNNDIYNIWEDRIKQVLEINGMDLNNNAALLNSMFECARKYINLE
ncbi:unknown [Clostridium sp. CAG:813]|nr:unknown [Clostridium sp. CAG:813]